MILKQLTKKYSKQLTFVITLTVLGAITLIGMTTIFSEALTYTNKSFTGTSVECEIIVNGGSLAGYFAAYTAAKELKKVCLIEPTNWVGGQLTNSGVPAIDWQWNSNITPSATGLNDGVNGQLPHTLRTNNNYQFFDMIASIGTKGKCWVSRDCFLSTDVLTKLNGLIAPLANLKVFYNSVPKNVTRVSSITKTDSYDNSTFNVNRISNIGIIQRTPISGTGYDKRFSSDVNDWYSEVNSSRFTKQKFVLKGIGTKTPVVLDTSENGEILALSEAAYLQGTDKFDGSVETSNDQCGQSTTHTFNMKYNSTTVAENAPAKSTFNNQNSTFNFGTGNWDKAWNYRRLAGAGNPYTPSLASGDISVMNWKSMGNNGNDYDKGYLFTSKANTQAQLSDWKGGYNIPTLVGAEDASYSFYYYMKENMPANYAQNRMNLDFASMGTTTGLYKTPYVRDTRRSVGIDNYVLKTSELLSQKPTGYRFKDRLATVNYGFDIHPIAGCAFSEDDLGNNYATPSYTEPYPFYVPLRSFTNKSIDNLVVGGKNIAQSFKVSAANRLQPSEATTGAAAGALATYMVNSGLSTYNIIESSSYNSTYVPAIQTIVKKYQSIDWTMNSVAYPAATEYLPNVKLANFCPVKSVYDAGEGFCVDSEYAYGPFSTNMNNACIALNNGINCSQTYSINSNNNMPMTVQKWPKKLARELRGTGVCMSGLTRDTLKPDYCIETIGGVKNVYGVFTQAQVNKCATVLLGGNACNNNKWNYNFVNSIL